MAARKAVDHELTKEAIMNAANELFVEKGYHGVSMRQIAAELNYSHGSIYYHFKNKAELFYSLVNRNFGLLDDRLDKILALELSPESKLEQLLLAYIRFGLEQQSHYEIMFVIKDSDLASKLQEKPNLLYEKFALAFHQLGGQASISLIWSVFLSLHGFVSHYLRTGLTYSDVETLAEQHVRFLLKRMS